MAHCGGDELMRVGPGSRESSYPVKLVDPAAHRLKQPVFELSGSSAMHIPHELQDEFSSQAGLIERLRSSNYDFGRLAARYEEVNRNIHRIESEAEPAEDAVIEAFKKHRLQLKDEIASFLARVERRM